MELTIKFRRSTLIKIRNVCEHYTHLQLSIMMHLMEESFTMQSVMCFLKEKSTVYEGMELGGVWRKGNSMPGKAAKT